jgi:CheY-like chemotaxis protein
LNLPRVLYVEDEDINFEITQRELEDRFDLVRARTAQEAFQLISTQKFHLILMDIQLSGSALDGLTAARILKGHEPEAKFPAYTHGVRALHTPIVFVTAYTARYSRDELIDAGGEDLVTKPVNFVRLSLVIARIWARGVSAGSV